MFVAIFNAISKPTCSMARNNICSNKHVCMSFKTNPEPLNRTSSQSLDFLSPPTCSMARVCASCGMPIGDMTDGDMAEMGGDICSTQSRQTHAGISSETPGQKLSCRQHGSAACCLSESGSAPLQPG
jgi:hypothetical protein